MKMGHQPWRGSRFSVMMLMFVSSLLVQTFASPAQHQEYDNDELQEIFNRLENLRTHSKRTHQEADEDFEAAERESNDAAAAAGDQLPAEWTDQDFETAQREDDIPNPSGDILAGEDQDFETAQREDDIPIFAGEGSNPEAAQRERDDSVPANDFPAERSDRQSISLYTSCKSILARNSNAPSGEYSIAVNRRIIQVYCEMGLNGGGYTFLHPIELPRLTDSQLQAIFTDKTSFLMRLRKTDGTQPYAVLRQLYRNRGVRLKLGVNSYVGYARPVNYNNRPFLYYGFLPLTVAGRRTVQGLKVNNVETTFTNCDANPNSYIALFPNFRETALTNYLYSARFTFSDRLFARHRRNPSGRVMPVDYFMFLETHWGGCGTFTQTDGRRSSLGILGANIGFR